MSARSGGGQRFRPLRDVGVGEEHQSRRLRHAPILRADAPHRGNEHAGRFANAAGGVSVDTMELRTLGNSGTIVSEYALGTMTFGAEADEQASHALIETYLDAGGNLIDTADVYSAGTSETIIGRWLADNPGRRDEVVIATKGRFPMGEGRNDLGLSRTHLRKALDASLSRLGVDHIDLYQMHAWDAITPIEETLRFLDDAVRAGKIGYYGFSNYLGWQLTKAVQLARAQRMGAARHPAAAVQPPRPRHRARDRARGARRRGRAAPVVSAGRRLAERQVHARSGADGGDPPGGEPETRHGGVGEAQRRPAHLGRHRHRPERRRRPRGVGVAGGARLALAAVPPSPPSSSARAPSSS